MPSVNVTIKPDIINWLLSQVDSIELSSDVYAQIMAWQTGEKIPTFRQVEDISNKTHIPFGYFFLEVPPTETCPIIDFRTVDSLNLENPSRDLLDVVDSMSDVQDWMGQFNRDMGGDPYPFVGKFSKSDSPIDIARDIRMELDLDINWYLSGKNAKECFKIARTAISNLGILVMMNGIVGSNTHRPLKIEEFRAFTLIDDYAPLIFINAQDTDNGRLFSLFHELAHIWLGTDSFYNISYRENHSFVDKNEVICNAVASEIIVPSDQFKIKWENIDGNLIDKISAAAKYFRCSRFVIARKAYDNGQISQQQYGAIQSALNKEFAKTKMKKRSGGGNYYKTLKSRWDSNFIRALDESTKKGRTLYTDAYNMTNTKGKAFHELTQMAGDII